MDIGRREEEEQRQAGPATQQGMQAIAQQERRGWWAGAWPKAASGSARRQARMGALSMMRSRARVNPIQSPARTSSTKSISLAGAPAARSRLTAAPYWAPASAHPPQWQAARYRQAGHAHNQSCTS